MTDTTPQRPPSTRRVLDSEPSWATGDRDAREMAQLVQDHASRAIERQLAMFADNTSLDRSNGDRGHDHRV